MKRQVRRQVRPKEQVKEASRFAGRNVNVLFITSDALVTRMQIEAGYGILTATEVEHRRFGALVSYVGLPDGSFCMSYENEGGWTVMYDGPGNRGDD